MNILITGASGFIGSRLTDYLSGKKYHLSVILRKGSSTEQLSPCLHKIKIYRYSGSGINELIDIMRASQPSLVIHTASLFLSNHTPGDIQSLVNSNLMFPVQLLEAMSVCGVRRFINTGTSWQHYDTSSYCPVNLYAATKQAFDDICKYYVEAKLFKVITLKLFDTYGPGDPRKKLLHVLKESIADSISIDMSPGEQKIDLVHIDDICNAYMCSIKSLMKMDEAAMEEYGVASGSPVSLRELVGLYEKVSGKELNVNWGGRPYREREVMSPWSNYMKVPGWRPAVSIEEGLRSII